MPGIGIDVSKAMLDVAIHGQPGLQRYPNTPAGIRRLLRMLGKLVDARVVVESTGGYESAVTDACAEAGLWVIPPFLASAKSGAKRPVPVSAWG